MIIDENWGIPAQRIRGFFAEQPDVEETVEGFLYQDCRIRMTPIPGNSLLQWDIPRTRVEMEGSREAVEAIHRRFFLRFLSAGG